MVRFFYDNINPTQTLPEGEGLKPFKIIIQNTQV